MPKLKLKKGDQVKILAGKDRGKKGKVLKIFPRKEQLIIEGKNLIKKHTRPTQKSPQGGIREREGPLHISNVQLICPNCNQPTRVAKGVTSSGSSVRVCKKCEADIDKG